MNHKCIVSLVCVLMCASVSQAVTTFDSRADWEAAVGAFVTDPFDSDMAEADVLNLDSGVTSTRNNNSGSQFHEISGGEFMGSVGASGDQHTWTFPAPVNAFGVDFSSIGLTFSISDGFGTVVVPDEGDDIFFGLIADSPFSSITLFNTSGGNDVFVADNLSFGNAPLTINNAVPEPITATLGLMGLGVLGMATRRRVA